MLSEVMASSDWPGDRHAEMLYSAEATLPIAKAVLIQVFSVAVYASERSEGLIGKLKDSDSETSSASSARATD